MPKTHNERSFLRVADFSDSYSLEWSDPVSKLISNFENGSDADPGCLSQIPDSGSKRFRIPDPNPHQRIYVN
jgi:hypothetical protein